jgi:hypothetical protein
MCPSSILDASRRAQARQLFSTWLQETAVDEERTGMLAKGGSSSGSSSAGLAGGSRAGEVSQRAFVAKTAGEGRGHLDEVE